MKLQTVLLTGTKVNLYNPLKIECHRNNHGDKVTLLIPDTFGTILQPVRRQLGIL